MARNPRNGQRRVPTKTSAVSYRLHIGVLPRSSHAKRQRCPTTYYQRSTNRLTSCVLPLKTSGRPTARSRRSAVAIPLNLICAMIAQESHQRSAYRCGLLPLTIGRPTARPRTSAVGVPLKLTNISGVLPLKQRSSYRLTSGVLPHKQRCLTAQPAVDLPLTRENQRSPYRSTSGAQ